MKIFYTYIIGCKNNTLYTGYTTDIKRRMIEHTDGTNCKYTKNYGFKKLEAYFESSSRSTAMKLESSRSTAMKLESYIKKMTRAKKLKIIENPNTLVEMFLNDKGERIRVGSMSVDIINNEVYELKKGID